MSKYSVGDMVVLASGSMRMTVERLEDETVHVVWCHEGRIGRDSFDEKLLNKWEVRPEQATDRAPRADFRDDRGPRPARPDFNAGGGDRGPRAPRDFGDRGPRKDFGNGPRPPRNDFRGDDRGPRPPRPEFSDRGPRKDFGGPRKDFGAPRGDDRPAGGKPGWDGRPREKKFYRKED